MRHLVAAIIAALTMSCAAFGSGASEEESFSYPGIEAVLIKAEFVNVEVNGDDGYAVTMSSELPQDFFGTRGYRVLHEVEGSRLKVWLEKDGPFGGSTEGTLTLQCPRDVRLKVETVSGRIDVEGMESRNCAVSTVSGGITLRENRGALSAASVSGSISFDADEGRVIAWIRPSMTSASSSARFREGSLSAPSGRRGACGWGQPARWCAGRAFREPCSTGKPRPVYFKGSRKSSTGRPASFAILSLFSFSWFSLHALCSAA